MFTGPPRESTPNITSNHSSPFLHSEVACQTNWQTDLKRNFRPRRMQELRTIAIDDFGVCKSVCHSSNTILLRSPSVSTPSRNSIRSAVFVQRSRVKTCDRQTDRRPGSSIAIVCTSHSRCGLTEEGQLLLTKRPTLVVFRIMCCRLVK